MPLPFLYSDANGQHARQIAEQGRSALPDTPRHDLAAGAAVAVAGRSGLIRNLRRSTVRHPAFRLTTRRYDPVAKALDAGCLDVDFCEHLRFIRHEPGASPLAAVARKRSCRRQLVSALNSSDSVPFESIGIKDLPAPKLLLLFAGQPSLVCCI